MVKNICKVRKTQIGSTACVDATLDHKFRQVNGQRTIGPKQAYEISCKARRNLARGGLKGSQRSRRKGQRWFLSEPNRVIGRMHRITKTRCIRMQSLDAAQRRKEIKTMRLALQRLL
jgi:hypothetical protein